MKSVPGLLFDSNLWVALTFAAHPYHDKAGEILAAAEGQNTLYRIHATEISSFRLATTPVIHRAYGVPIFSNSDAISYFADLFEKTGCHRLAESEKTYVLWLGLADVKIASPKKWMDAYLAAVAIEAEVTFATLDTDFVTYESDGLDLMLI